MFDPDEQSVVSKLVGNTLKAHETFQRTATLGTIRDPWIALGSPPHAETQLRSCLGNGGVIDFCGRVNVVALLGGAKS